MIAFLTARAIPGVESVRDGRYARTLVLGEARGVVMIEPGEGAKLKATLRFPNVQAWPAVLARVRRVFDLAADPAAIAAHLSEDPDLAPMVAARPGLRAPGAWDGFELAVRAVLGQQITVHAARMLAGKIAAVYGAPLEDEAANALGLTRFFPTPAQLALADVETLAMPRARGRALVGLAPCRGSANGPPSTSPCGRFGSPTPSPAPTSA
jgi:AraC family transcriptional regulator of adaptative response / DNA-3-methyladenine glycosylase II